MSETRNEMVRSSETIFREVNAQAFDYYTCSCTVLLG